METPFVLMLFTGAFVVFGVGLLIGLGFRSMRQDNSREVEDLKVALRQNEEELRQYRDRVTHHFTQTADLVHTLTADYRAVYEHLAAGAQTLCNGQVKALTPEALREHLLTAPGEGGARAEVLAPQPASSLPEGQPPLTEEGDAQKPSAAPAPVPPEEGNA